MSTSLRYTSTDLPRVSANQLGEFAFSSPARKRQIVRDQKFGNPHTSPYYQRALNGLLRSLRFGTYDDDSLHVEIKNIEDVPARNRNHAIRLNNNATMLKHFREVASLANPPAGSHTIVRRNALIPINGVIVSVRPEIVTHCMDTGKVCFTKLRFSKSKVSADASELILLLLLKYGTRSFRETFDSERTILIDCFTKNLTHGYSLPALREKQLSSAIREYRNLWPMIRLDKNTQDNRATGR